MSYQLYSYWRSTASWRVRLVLEIKQLDYQIVPVHLLRDGGEQHQAAYRAINPLGLVPSLRDGDWQLSQSGAICDYLERRHPQPALMPEDARAAAEVRAFCDSIACDTHPLNNLAVLQYLQQQLQQDEEARGRWYQHWIQRSFSALQSQLARRDQGPYCFGAQLSLADCYLIPQLYNARRFNCPLQDYPHLLAVEAACEQLPAFQAAHPQQQIDKPD